MLMLMTFLALVVLIFSSLSPATRGKILRFILPTFLITFGWVCAFIIGAVISMMFSTQDVAKVLDVAFPLTLSKATSAQMDKAQTFGGIASYGLLLIPTMIFDMVFGSFKLALSFKFPFLSFMLFGWVMFASFVIRNIVIPSNEMAKREAEQAASNPTAGMSYDEQLWTLIAQKNRDDAIKAEQAVKAEAYRKANPDAGKSQHVHGPW